MTRDFEIEARIPSVDALRPRAAAIADRGPEPIAQDDTFLACGAGRLELRELWDRRGELIFHRRDDVAGPTTSFFVRMRAPDPAGLREVRTLFLAGGARIHPDEVEGLGARPARACSGFRGSRAS